MPAAMDNMNNMDGGNFLGHSWLPWLDSEPGANSHHGVDTGTVVVVVMNDRENLL